MLKQSAAGEEVLWAPTLGYAELRPPVARTLAVARQRLEEAGIEVVEASRNCSEHPLPSWWTLWAAQMARVLGSYRGHGGLGCD